MTRKSLAAVRKYSTWGTKRRFLVILLIAMASIVSGCYLEDPLVHKSHLPLDPLLIGTWEDKDKAKLSISRHSETEYVFRNSKGEMWIAFPGRLGNHSFIQVTAPQNSGKIIYVVFSYAVSGDTLELNVLNPKPTTDKLISILEIRNALLRNSNTDNLFVKVATLKKIVAASETAKSLPVRQQTQDANLLSAGVRGDFAAVEQAVAKGANVNAKDINGATALMMAARNGRVSVVKELLAKGADFVVKDKNGRTAFDLAEAGKHDEIAIELMRQAEIVENDKEIAKLEKEIAEIEREKGKIKNEIAVIDQEIARKQNESSAISKRITAKERENEQLSLIIAAGEGDVATVKRLLAKGINVNFVIGNGGTALSAAASEGKLAVVQMLLLRGANVNVKDNEGFTPLMLAAQEGHLEIVRALLTKRALINAKSVTGSTALMLAVNNDHVDVVDLLVAKGADVNAENAKGISAFDLAAVSDLFGEEMLEILTAKTRRPQTPKRAESRSVKKPLARRAVSQPVCTDYLFRVNAFLQTGIVIKRGDKLTFGASGTVSFGLFAGSGGPEGINGFREYNLAAGDFQHGLLIGRIDRDLGYFAIGKGGVMESAKVDGVLDLNVNDADTSNNGGYFEVKINICRAK